jgi:type II secretory pathway component PulF
MKFDEFAFVNHQLAGMLRSGIPLEGALRQMCATMKRNALRAEFQSLEADLAQGVPLAEAMERRRFPLLYVAMVRVGVASQDLAGVLTLLADYYQRLGTVWVRLKGLMVYPLIVLAAAFAASFAIGAIFGRVMENMTPELTAGSQVRLVLRWVAPATVAVLLALFVAGLALPPWRGRLRWRLPGFREASLAQAASALALLLHRGTPLQEALELLRRLEGASPAGQELQQWQERLRLGHRRLADVVTPGRVFPPLFAWLVSSGGEDVAGGFRRAAEIFHARALHRIEMLLYGFLPVSVLVLGVMILGQAYPVLMLFRQFMSLDGMSE